MAEARRDAHQLPADARSAPEEPSRGGRSRLWAAGVPVVSIAASATNLALAALTVADGSTFGGLLFLFIAVGFAAGAASEWTLREH